MRIEESGSRRLRPVLVLLLVLIAGYLVYAGFNAGLAPQIEIHPATRSIGRKTSVHVEVREPVRGLGRIKAELVQGERSETLVERSFSTRPAWSLWGTRTERDEMALEVGKEAHASLREGQATIRVTADRAPSWFRSPEPALQEITLPVRFTPPSLQITSTATYVAQGGSEAVVHRAGNPATRHGVQAGSRWFPGFPLPGGGPQDRFAFFAVPYDLSDETAVKLVASDDVGNSAGRVFDFKIEVRRRRWRRVVALHERQLRRFWARFVSWPLVKFARPNSFRNPFERRA